jgi:energy-coupling factor transporter ATP-binding protein EcfA2
MHHPKLLAMGDEMFRFACDLRHRPKGGRLLVLCGPSGCGKTHAARSLVGWFGQIRMRIGPVVTETEEGVDSVLPSACSVSWPDVVRGFKQQRFDILDQLEREYLTVLDDIGAEHDPSGFGVERICMILTTRERRYSVITTNIQPGQWLLRLSQRCLIPYLPLLQSLQNYLLDFVLR